MLPSLGVAAKTPPRATSRDGVKAASTLNGRLSRRARAFPAGPPSPLAQYFSRSARRSSTLSTRDLPFEKGAAGVFTPVGATFTLVKLTVPLAYAYVLLILWRELCVGCFPDVMIRGRVMTTYLPWLVWLANAMESSSRVVEVWAVVEAIFYVCLVLHRRWLNSIDTLELCLRAAPMLELAERDELWGYMMESEDQLVRFVTGWFFAEKLEKLKRLDILDFFSWSMFEGRNIEHLTSGEMHQLHWFIADIEYRISLELYGVVDDDDQEQERQAEGGENCTVDVGEETKRGEKAENENADATRYLGDNGEGGGKYALRSPPSSPFRRSWMPTYGIVPDGKRDSPQRTKKTERRQRPKKVFQFQENRDETSHPHFSDLYESYKDWCEQYREMLENRNFHPVQMLENRKQGIRNFVADNVQRLHEAEELALARATDVSTNAYYRVIERGGGVDKRITALGHATQSQLTDAWNSMWMMKERLQTATDISTRRKALRQQLRSYRHTLDRMGGMTAAVPSGQLADLMRKITQCYESLERVERSAMDAFYQVTGSVGQVGRSLLQSEEPPRYLKYSSDPLMDVSSYPLMFHILILVATEGGLRVMMKQRGFQRLRVGPISYYYHPGDTSQSRERGDDDDDDGGGNREEEGEIVPIVFCHGIGIGLIFYMTLVDELLKIGKPLIFPEIPYVSGFRPWQGPNCVLPPAAVTSTLMSILACHGHERGAFIGHSYGTSWVSYMCKYGPSAVACAMFLDPICFCLHYPRLTKNFVYHRADPGSTSNMIRTDVVVNWTIQRGFPWARISLFTEQIPDIPCAVFLSECDALVPSAKAEKYLRSKGAVVSDATEADREHFARGPISVTIFRNQGHSDWPLQLWSNRLVADAAGVLVTKIQPVVHDDSYSY